MADEDPCAILDQLRNARIALLTGENAVRISLANGMDVTYSNVDMAALERAIGEYDSLCRAKQGKAPRRYAMRLGAMR